MFTTPTNDNKLYTYTPLLLISRVDVCMVFVNF